MEAWWADAPRIFAGLLMLSLALWAGASAPGRRLVRAFVLFMALRGLLNIVLSLAHRPSVGADLWVDVSGYLEIAVPFAAAFFALRFIEETRGRPVPKWSFAGLLAGCVGLELAYLIDHDLLFGEGRGLVLWIVSVGSLIYMVIGHLILRQADPSTNRVAMLVGVSFVLFPMFAAGLDLAYLAYWTSIGAVAGLVGVGRVVLWTVRFLCVAYAVYIALLLRSREFDRRGATIAAWAMVLAFISGTLPMTTLRLLWEPSISDPMAALFNGLWTAAQPVALGFVIMSGGLGVQHRPVAPSTGSIVSTFTVAWTLLVVALYLGAFDQRELSVFAGTLAGSLILFASLQMRTVYRLQAQTGQEGA